jgi:AcrR family transcriptional regulator
VTTQSSDQGTRADRGTSRRAAQREATRERLFTETVEEFRRRGFSDTEIAAITERVGVTRGAFYVHFAGKEQVLSELLLIEERRIAAAARRVAEQGGQLEDVLQALVDAVLRAERRLGRSLVRDLCAGPFLPGVAQGYETTDHPVGVLLVEFLAGSALEVDPVDFAMVFLTGLFGLLATDESPLHARRRRLGLLVRMAVLEASSS